MPLSGTDASWKVRQPSSGFTLLEILFVLAIVSILAMIAVPYYQDYRTRVKIAGELTLMEPVKKTVTEDFMVRGSWPSNNTEATLNAASTYHGEYLQSVQVSDTPTAGSLTLKYDSNKLPALGSNDTIIFYPINVSNSGSVSWACDEGSMENIFRPMKCRR